MARQNSRAAQYLPRQRPRYWRELLASMADSSIDPPRSDADLRILLAEAERNELGPHVAHALMRAGDDRHWVVERHERSEQRLARMLAAAEDVARTLDEVGIPVVALKNVGIARAIHPCAGCTPMGDIDLLVRREDFRRAHEAVVAAGLRHDTRAPTVEPADLEHALVSGGAEYRYGEGSDEVWIELQWRPVAGRWIQPHQEPSAADLLDRSRPIEESSLRLLDPTDNMLQVALHTAKHSYCRAPGLRLHTDVHRLAKSDPPDWDRFLREAERLGVRTAVFFSLSIASSLLASPVPSRVVERLAPSSARERAVATMLRRAGLFEPHEPKFARPAMLAFHALLYDSGRLFLASALDSSPSDLRWRQLPTLAQKGLHRSRDLIRRYES